MKSDLFGSLLLGFLTAAFFLLLSYTTLTVLRPEDPPPLYYWGSLVVFPAISSLGIVVLADLGKRLKIFALAFQFYKFGLVGVFNTLIDLAILNALIVATGLTAGAAFSLFKGITFLIAVANSYFWNKLWTFRKKEGGSPVEFGKFVVISGAGLSINVAVASFFVNVVGPPGGIHPQLWASISALYAIAFSMLWNFAGYKLFVFKKS